MKAPHILLASSNVHKMRANLLHLLDAANQQAVDSAIAENVRLLYELGKYHFDFATSLAPVHWRQITSRHYYGAYNFVRACRFCENGAYSTDSTDHKKVNDLPTALANAATYAVQLPLLRDDRNLCDYDHSAVETDLAISVGDARKLIEDLRKDIHAYLTARGIRL